MTADRAGFLQHLREGVTTVCRCWAVVRTDGMRYGFTDHDRDLSFDGTEFRASSGLTARALQQATGLSVDNSEAVGALSSAALSEGEIASGRFDGAEVRCWQVNWAMPDQRHLVFRGHFGDVTRIDGQFRVELRGLAEALNQPVGRVYHSECSAVLGDARCGADLGLPGRRVAVTLERRDGPGGLLVAGAEDLPEGWFARGTLVPLTGPGAGLAAMIRDDRRQGALRRLELWAEPADPLIPGMALQLTVGCDRTAAMCRGRFQNFVNFRGFPHIPGEDWLSSYPVPGRPDNGASLFG